MVSILLLLAGSAFAQDYYSEEQEVLFQDDFDVFESLEYDSGALPSGSPITIRAYVESNGAAITEMEAISWMWWPDALTHEWEAIPGTGWFALVTDLEIGLEGGIDVWGYVDTFDIWSESLELHEDLEFDPLLLPGSPTESIEVSASGSDIIDPVEVDIAIVTGVSLVVSASFWPDTWATLEGIAIETNGSEITEYGGTEILDIPEDDPGLFVGKSIYYAMLEAGLDLVIEPAASLSTPFGDVELASFEIPIELGGASEMRAFDTVTIEHPLPAIDSLPTTHDFGVHLVGTLDNHELELGNIGQLDLEGWLSIEGDEAFSVFPEYIHATEGNTDGVVITYSPTGTGLQTAVLTIQTNDPGNPEIKIPLAGTGYSDVEDPIENLGEDYSVSITTCGCASQSANAGLPWVLLLGLLVPLRRRTA